MLGDLDRADRAISVQAPAADQMIVHE